MSKAITDPIVLQERMRRDILREGDLVPPLPDLVVRVLAALNAPDTEPADLELLLQNDQVLVGRMLAMVNSPFYGLNRPVRGIREAVMVLGFRGVRSLVMIVSTSRFLQRDLRCYGHTPKGLWLHAACVAAAARSLAQTCRLGDDEAEAAFVAGLMHDIGKLLLATKLKAARPPDAQALSSEQAERAVIGIDHAEAGALVAAKWNLAPELQDVIALHHRDGAPPTRLAAIVRVADAVAHGHGAGYEPGSAPPAAPLQADLDALGLIAAWPSLRDDLIVRMDDAARALVHLGC